MLKVSVSQSENGNKGVTHCALRLVGGSYSIDQDWHDQTEELKQLHDYLLKNEWTITKK